MPYIYPIILSGGVGSRLWPVSRTHFPKQMSNLCGELSLLQETALRMVGGDFAKPLIICHSAHRFLVAEQMNSIGIQPAKIILEPFGRNTAPAAAVAALTIAKSNPDAVLLLMPADQVIRDVGALHRAVQIAFDQANQGYLVTLGIQPRGPETGYGYIKRGASLIGGDAFVVSHFVEKPDAAAAGRYVDAGHYYWNSGIFAFQAKTYLAELQKFEPDIISSCKTAVSEGAQDATCFQLGADSFQRCKSISIDYAVMEHTDRAVIVPVEMGWSDVGSWAALWDLAKKDPSGNAIKGDVLHQSSQNSYLRSEGPLIAAIGVKDLVVVASPDAVLVCSKSATQEVKTLVERLEQQGRSINNRRIDRPWGSSERIDQGENFEVNKITVNPGTVMLLQTRDSYAKRWVVASGIGRIIRDHEALELSGNDAYVPSADDRRLENIGIGPLHIIEMRAKSV